MGESAYLIGGVFGQIDAEETRVRPRQVLVWSDGGVVTHCGLDFEFLRERDPRRGQRGARPHEPEEVRPLFLTE